MRNSLTQSPVLLRVAERRRHEIVIPPGVRFSPHPSGHARVNHSPAPTALNRPKMRGCEDIFRYAVFLRLLRHLFQGFGEGFAVGFFGTGLSRTFGREGGIVERP